MAQRIKVPCRMRRRRAAPLGLALADIRELLAVRDTGTCPCEPAEALLDRRLAELDAEIERLCALRGELVAMLQQLPTAQCPAPEPGSWCPPTEGGAITMPSLTARVRRNSQELWTACPT
jgi:hypothetical protein